MKYHKLTENAVKPTGFWGRLMIRSMNKGHHNITDWALSYFDVQNGNIVLDIGCGGGRTVNKLCTAVGSGKVYGVDYSELCVKKSLELNRKNVLCRKAVIEQASVSELPFEDNTFDKIIAVETYYFWPDKLNDLKEVLRVLKRGGRLMLVFEMLFDEQDPDKWTAVEKRLDIQAVRVEDIQNMLRDAGFIKIETYTKEGTSWLCAVGEKEVL
ncbi:MAG: class I SAM-dependent methyltransferase [Ruminococcus sp.]|nr:class I SAM-dependent methyltransferase [Ruminococcus sp.]